MNTSAIIQARMTSTRLPGKTLMDLNGKPTLQRVIERTRAANLIDDIVVATTTNKTDDPIIELCKSMGCHYFRGSENDVLSRVLGAAKEFYIDVIVEITADCPLIDPEQIDYLIEMHRIHEPDITMNILERSFPRGYDTRIFNTAALDRTNNEVDNPIDRQHVSPWMYLNPKGKKNFKTWNWVAPDSQYRPDIEVTLDTPEDLELIRWIFSFEDHMILNCENVIKLIDDYPEKYRKVAKTKRKDYYQELLEYYLNNNII